ncbi:MAG: site-specific integrase [Candidatus Omnitrophica bacterium]|nr:site-specific integrase [Candidatus Omnitrophota bacterium]
MRVSGKIISRCEACRKKSNSGWGSCKHKGKRKYIVDYRIDGKRYRETVGFNKSVAEKRLSEIIAQVHSGTFFQSKTAGVTFAEYAEKWLSDYSKPRVKPNTHTTYSGYIRNHLNSVFGQCDLSAITQSDLESHLSKLHKKYNPNTVNKILKMLKTMFKYARRWKYLIENPAWDIDCYREEHREMDYLQPQEIHLVLDNSREPYKTMILTAILTGMRKSELLGLQWGDIDWNSNTIYVRRSIHWETRKHVGEGKLWRFDSPKTRNSIRAIIMTPKMKEALERHRFSETVRYAQKDHPANEDDLLFTNECGNPTDPNNMIKRGFHPALEAAGLRKIRFHDLRHTFASLLIDQGENLKFIQSQLGHASIQTTIDRYGHLMPLKNYEGVGLRLDQKIFESTFSESPEVLKAEKGA